MKFGIIKETKVPHEDRVVFTPDQCREMSETFENLQFEVQPYEFRCYSDNEYVSSGIPVNNDLSNCDILFGVKEMKIESLIAGARYCCFSHTIKKQASNKALLKKILELQITLIDYEKLTDEQGKRLVAFGTYAGVCGAYNAIWAYGKKSNTYLLPRLNTFNHYSEVIPEYKKMNWPGMKIVLTGTGRVGKGALRVLQDMGFKELDPEEFLNEGTPLFPVFTVLTSSDYILPKDNEKVFDKEDYYANPEKYKANFLPYLRVADIFINGIYWNPSAPKFFELTDLKTADIQVQVIGDITCDISPESSIPTTIRASSIAEPVYGIDRQTGKEVAPYSIDAIDVMAIDNVANELSRDASAFFGKQLIDFVVPEFFKTQSEMLQRATIAQDGKLTERYLYLSDYVNQES